MKKKLYLIPRIDVITLEIEGLLSSLSLGVDDNPSESGGGDAKKAFFDFEEEGREYDDIVWSTRSSTI